MINDFLHKLIITDKANLHLNGFEYNLDHVFWETLVFLKKKPPHPLPVTFWCNIFAQGVVDLHFFKENEGITVAVNSSAMEKCSSTTWHLKELGLKDMWLQQDGATAHASKQIKAILRNIYLLI